MRPTFKALAAAAGLLVIGYPLGVALVEIKHTTDAVKRSTEALSGREAAAAEAAAPAASAPVKLQTYQP